jgi:two-component system sensor histidine kinase ChvG
MEASNNPAPPAPLFSRLLHSFSLKLFCLALVLLTIPLVVYLQFVRAERQQYSLLRNAAGQTGRVIASMLRTHLEQFSNQSPDDLRAAVKAAAIGKTNIKVLMRPAGVAADDFTYIASYPPQSGNYLRTELARLSRLGLLQRLEPTCDKASNSEIRFINAAGDTETLTSMTPVHIGPTCWIVITSQSTSALAPIRLNLSFWRSMPMQIATVVYLLGMALVIWLFAHMWRNVARFRNAARRIRFRRAGVTSFRELNSIPELSRVAEDFDSLVEALINSQSLIKRAAEETTHALKAPLAVIAQAIEPLKRNLRQDDPAANRSVQLIERSVAKLDNLVSAARDLEHAAADVIYPIRQPIDLSSFLSQMLEDYDIALEAQGKSLTARISENVTVYASEDLIEPVVENLLENAASFTPQGGAIEVSLYQQAEYACVAVSDRGPGVPPEKLDQIFERYVSFRTAIPNFDNSVGAQDHQGLGLWVVKRNIEGLGGSVLAHNRQGGGFEVTVRLQARF